MMIEKVIDIDPAAAAGTWTRRNGYYYESRKIFF